MLSQIARGPLDSLSIASQWPLGSVGILYIILIKLKADKK